MVESTLVSCRWTPCSCLTSESFPSEMISMFDCDESGNGDCGFSSVSSLSSLLSLSLILLLSMNVACGDSGDGDDEERTYWMIFLSML